MSWLKRGGADVPFLDCATHLVFKRIRNEPPLRLAAGRPPARSGPIAAALGVGGREAGEGTSGGVGKG